MIILLNDDAHGRCTPMRVFEIVFINGAAQPAKRTTKSDAKEDSSSRGSGACGLSARLREGKKDAGNYLLYASFSLRAPIIHKPTAQKSSTNCNLLVGI